MSDLLFGRRSARSQRGHAVIEAALLAPWILLLFAGTFDMGMYAYALICTQNAARVAATYTSSASTRAADADGACRCALSEMNSMANVRGLNSCNSLPVIVTATAGTGVDGGAATNVSVTYRTDQFFPLPGLAGRLTMTRTAQMRMRQ